MSDSPLLQSAALVAASIAATALRRTCSTIAGYLAIGLLMSVALFFLTMSGYRAAASSLGDVAAGAIVGTVYLILALVVLLAQQLARR